MKKVLLLTALLVIALFSTAKAETLTVGGKEIHYEIPEGHVLAQGGRYEDVREMLRNVLPTGTRLHAIYVRKDADERFRASDDAPVSHYMLLMSLGRTENEILTAKNFKELKDYLIKHQGTILGKDTQDKVNAVFKEKTDGQFKLGETRSLGTFGATDTQISFMALMSMAVNDGGTQTQFNQATVTTQLLVDGKLLTINQYIPADDPAEVTAFRDQSLKTLKSMKFKEGESGGAMKYVAIFLLLIFVGGFFAFRRYHKKKYDNMADAGQDLKNLAGEAQKNIKDMFKKD